MILLASFIAPLLPYMLSFAAGAMMYVVIEELIPEAQGGEHSNIGTIGAAAGFVVMMCLIVRWVRNASVEDGIGYKRVIFFL